MRKDIGIAMIGLCAVLGVLLAGSAFAASSGTTGTNDSFYLISVAQTSFLPSTIFAGDAVSLAVDAENKGLAVSVDDLNATLDVGNQFEPIALSDSAAQIQPTASKTLVFKFRVRPDTGPGYYPAQLTLNYLRNGVAVTQSLSVTIPVSKTQKNLELSITPAVINPASQTMIDFVVSNVGQSPVSNLSVSWTETNNLILPLGTGSTRYIPYLEGGASATVSYVVTADPNITTGVYPLNVTLKYSDQNGTQSQQTQVGMIIGGGTDFEVSAETASGGVLSVSVANIGANNAGAVVVKIPAQPGISVMGSSVSILGNLNKGDYTVANFTVSTGLDQNAAGNGANAARPFGLGANAAQGAAVDQNRSNGANGTTLNRGNASATGRMVRIEIDYTDTTGTRQRLDKEVSLGVSAGATVTGTGGAGGFAARNGSNGNLLPWALGFLVIIGGLAWYHFKQPKANRNRLIAVLAVCAALFAIAIVGFNGNLLEVLIAGVLSVGALVWFFRSQKEPA